MLKKHVGTGEAARLLGISVEAVQRLCIAGKLKAKRKRFSGESFRWVISRHAIGVRIKHKAAGGIRHIVRFRVPRNKVIHG